MDGYSIDKLFSFDKNTAGTKGLVFIGDKLLIYRRDRNTDVFPQYLDVPGGGPLTLETPYETFRREVKEEFDLDINKANMVYVKKYQSTKQQGKYEYFCVAKLSQECEARIMLGDEGYDYYLMSIDEYLGANDAWPVFQQRTKEYINSTL